MAEINHLIPHFLHFEAGVPVKELTRPLEEQFATARRRGWSDDPDDPGGKTMIGVTLDTYRTYCRRKGYPVPTPQRLRDMTFATWRDILKTLYWDRMGADGIHSQGIANICVDWLWASGPGMTKRIQRILGVKADGIVGPKTLAAINAADPTDLFTRLYNARVSYYKGCKAWWKYSKGWMRRLDAIKPDGSFTIHGERIVPRTQ